jgi:hypothetical protein
MKMPILFGADYVKQFIRRARGTPFAWSDRSLTATVPLK